MTCFEFVSYGCVQIILNVLINGMINRKHIKEVLIKNNHLEIEQSEERGTAGALCNKGCFIVPLELSITVICDKHAASKMLTD